MDERLLETPNTEVRERTEQQSKDDEFNAFLAQVKDNLDKVFDNLGYVVFVFDKKNPSNKYVACLSNVPNDCFLSKVYPFFRDFRLKLNKTQKNLRKRLGRVK